VRGNGKKQFLIKSGIENKLHFYPCRRLVIEITDIHSFRVILILEKEVQGAV
jgi:hypothetical protein